MIYNMKQSKKEWFLILVMSFCGLFVMSLCVTLRAHAAELYFYPNISTIILGKTQVIEVRLKTDPSESINALQIHGNYDTSALEAVSLETGGSIMSLLAEAPTFHEGKFSFTGGIPNGFTGDGLLFTLLVKGVEIKNTTLAFSPTTSAFLNSENAQKATLTLQEATIQVFPQDPSYVPITSKSHPDETKWSYENNLYVSWEAVEGEEYSYKLSRSLQDEPDLEPKTPVGDLKFANLEDGIYYFSLCKLPVVALGRRCLSISRYRAMIDQTPPEWLSVHVSKGTEDTNFLPYISFVARDVTSGMAGDFVSVDGGPYQSATSPYVVREKGVKRIEIKAADKTGNEQGTTVTIPRAWYTNWAVIGSILLAVIAVGLGIFIRKHIA